MPDTTSTQNVPPQVRPAPFPVFRELALLAGVLVSVFFLPYLYTQARTPIADASTQNTAQTAAFNASNDALKIPDAAAFEHIALLGKTSAVYDVARGAFLYTQAPDAVLPIASITKLMTSLVAYELLPALETIVTIPEATTDEYSALAVGDSMTARDLIDYTLLVSSNEGANALAIAAITSALGTKATTDDFIRAMNVRAKTLGLTHTHFKNVTGLDIGDAPGATSSAQDIAKLLAYITTTYPDLLTATQSSERDFVGSKGLRYEAKNTNGVVRNIPGLIASKTGFEVTAGGTLAVAFNAGLDRTIVVVVLGSTWSGRFDDILELVTATQESL